MNNIKIFLAYIIKSLDNGHKGASGKKVIAYMVAICIVVAHTSYLRNAHLHNDYSLLMQVLIFDGALITTLYGINVTDKKINKPNETPTT